MKHTRSLQETWSQDQEFKEVNPETDTITMLYFVVSKMGSQGGAASFTPGRW